MRFTDHISQYFTKNISSKSTLKDKIINDIKNYYSNTPNK